MQTFQELAKTKKLGDFICLYPFRKTSLLTIVVFILIVTPMAALMLLGGIVLATGSVEPGLAPRILGLVFTVVGVTAFCSIPYTIFRRYLVSKKRGVHFYELGFITLKNFRAIAVRYSDIYTLRIKVTDYLKVNPGGNYTYLGSGNFYTIRTTKGKKVVFDNSYKNIRHLGLFLSDKLVEHRFSEVFEWYLSGDIIEFGKIRVHLDYLKIGRRKIDWNTILNVKVKEGYLLVVRDPEEWAADRVKIADIPNFPLLTELLRQSLKCPISIGS